MGSGDDPRHDQREQARQEGLAGEGDRRRFLYRDVEELLTVGFLTVSVPLRDSLLVFRTVNSASRVTVDALTRSSDSNWKRRYLCSSLWLVNGFDLTHMPNAPFYAFEYFLKDLHRVYVDALLSLVLGVHRRVERAHSKVEAYCYETYSRSLWRVRYEGSKPFPNSVHQTWSAYNRSEDDREQDKEQWSRTQAVVASMSSKGGKAVRRQLEMVKSREEQRQQSVIEDMVNAVIQGSKPARTHTIMVNGKPVEVPRITSARTVAELEEEMRKVMEGEQDLHDLHVHEYEEAIRKAVEERRKASEKRHQQQSEMQHLMHQAGIGGRTELVGYSPQQMAAGLGPRSAGVKQVVTSSDSRRLYERYVQGGTKVGVLGKSGVPEPLQENDLQSSMQDRNPSFRSDAIAPAVVRGTDGD
jgi:hypothetical protein